MQRLANGAIGRVAWRGWGIDWHSPVFGGGGVNSGDPFLGLLLMLALVEEIETAGGDGGCGQ